MWYIFPQVKGLGFSETSEYYAIASVEEAKAFLDHPVFTGEDSISSLSSFICSLPSG